MKVKKIKLLIADDDKPFISTLEKFLLQEKYDIDSVNNGNVAFQKLIKNKYDLCLLDIMLPEMNGIDVLTKIKKNPIINTSFVMMTGYNDINTIIEVMKLGADDYVSKPINFEELKIIFNRVLEHRKIKLENIKYKKHLEKEIEKKTREIKKSFVEIINAFTYAIQTRDNYTGNHIRRVSEIAYKIGKQMGLSNEKLEEIKFGGILHDIGKIGIPDKILKKKEKLTDQEYKEIQKHPEYGLKIVKDIDSIKSVIPYILYHQERFDGTGYPKGLKGKKIPFEGRLLAVADAYEAMTSHRPYKKKLTPKQSIDEILTYSGIQFDPDIVKIFVEIYKNKLLDL